MATLAERTGWRAFGLLPFFRDSAQLPAEDAFGLGEFLPRTDGVVTIAVPMLARIANFDDFDPLRIEPSVQLVFVRAGEPSPGRRPRGPARQQRDDRRSCVLSAQGWDIDLLAHVRRGGRVLGICGENREIRPKLRKLG
jgi:adenosylcobyric acid synthase